MISSRFNTDKEVAGEQRDGGQGKGQQAVQAAEGTAKGPEAKGVTGSSSLSPIASSTSLMLGESWQVMATAGSVTRRRTSVEVSARVASPVAESLEPTIIDRGQEIDGGVVGGGQTTTCLHHGGVTHMQRRYREWRWSSSGGRAAACWSPPVDQGIGRPRQSCAIVGWVPTIDLSCRSGDHGGYDH